MLECTESLQSLSEHMMRLFMFCMLQLIEF